MTKKKIVKAALKKKKPTKTISGATTVSFDKVEKIEGKDAIAITNDEMQALPPFSSDVHKIPTGLILRVSFAEESSATPKNIGVVLDNLARQYKEHYIPYKAASNGV